MLPSVQGDVLIFGGRNKNRRRGTQTLFRKRRCRKPPACMPLASGYTITFSFVTCVTFVTNLSFHESLKFLLYAQLCCIAPHTVSNFGPCHILKNLIPDDSLHSLWDSKHPKFHLLLDLFRPSEPFPKNRFPPIQLVRIFYRWVCQTFNVKTFRCIGKFM